LWAISNVFFLFPGPITGYVSAVWIHTGQDKGELPASTKAVMDLMGAVGLIGKEYEVHTDNWYTSPCQCRWGCPSQLQTYAAGPACKGPW